MHFLNVYWDEAWMRRDDKFPSIIAIGDSWFWYPFPGGSLLNRLGPMVAPREHVILAYGYNGAEAFDYVHGSYAKQIRNALRLYGSSLSAVFISGGGNDFAGLNDLRPMLLADCSSCASAAACFRTPAEFGSMGWLLDKVAQSYLALIEQIVGATWRPAGEASRIILHTYDYAPVNGVGLFGPDSSPWLQPAFAAARVPQDLRDDCIRLLVDTFADTLGKIAARYPGRVSVVDSRGALQRGDWANELHPKPAGFDKIAARWLPVLRAQGLAN